MGDKIMLFTWNGGPSFARWRSNLPAEVPRWLRQCARSSPSARNEYPDTVPPNDTDSRHRDRRFAHRRDDRTHPDTVMMRYGMAPCQIIESQPATVGVHNYFYRSSRLWALEGHGNITWSAYTLCGNQALPSGKLTRKFKITMFQ